MSNINKFGLEEILDSVSRPNNTDLSAKQYAAVKIDSDGYAVVIAAANDPVFGILQNAPEANTVNAKIATRGISRITLGATVATGDKMTIDAAGLGKVAATGETFIGVCVAGGVAGVQGSVNLDAKLVLSP